MNNSLTVSSFSSSFEIKYKQWLTLVQTNRFLSKLVLFLFAPVSRRNRNIFRVFLFQVSGSVRPSCCFLVSRYPSLILYNQSLNVSLCCRIPCRFCRFANSKSISVVYKPAPFLYYELPQCLRSDPSLGGIPQSVLIKSRFI